MSQYGKRYGKTLSQDEVKSLVAIAEKEKRGRISSTIQWPALSDLESLIAAVEKGDSYVDLDGMMEQKRATYQIRFYEKNDDLFFIAPMPGKGYTPNGCFSIRKCKENLESYKAALYILEEERVSRDGTDSQSV